MVFFNRMQSPQFNQTFSRLESRNYLIHQGEKPLHRNCARYVTDSYPDYLRSFKRKINAVCEISILSDNRGSLGECVIAQHRIRRICWPDVDDMNSFVTAFRKRSG